MKLQSKCSGAIALLIAIGILITVLQLVDRSDDSTTVRWFRSFGRSTPQTSDISQAIHPRRSSSSLIVVDKVGNFTDRILSFNYVLNELLLRIRKERPGNAMSSNFDNVTIPMVTPLDVVSGIVDNYIDLVATNYSQVITTVVLPWLSSQSSVRSGVVWNSLEDTVNVELQRYYQWTADDRLCGWIETPGAIKLKYDVIYNRKCERNVTEAVSRPSSLPIHVLNSKPLTPSGYWPNDGKANPAHFYNSVPSYVFHLHIYRDAIITGVGDVISRNTKLVLYACSIDMSKSLPLDGKLSNVPVYDELYVISQYWGSSVFHRMTEVMPRLALCVDFLRNNPDVRIHAPETASSSILSELVRAFQLDPSRLVSGVARARVVYQPRSTMCGFANVAESQAAMRLYASHIRRNWPDTAVAPADRLILIRRSGSRRFTEQVAIEKAVQQVATDFNLTYTLFIDNPVPPLDVTMRWFHTAAMIVAPHGAGLSNMYFSRPGTYVVEGVCNIPHVNLCFQRLAQVLGHRWHGVTSHGGCESVVSIPWKEIDTAVRSLLTIRDTTVHG